MRLDFTLSLILGVFVSFFVVVDVVVENIIFCSEDNTYIGIQLYYNRIGQHRKHHSIYNHNVKGFLKE